MEELIRLEDLNVSFATTNGYKPIIKGINLSIQPGEIVGLVGESGSGKSVTARSIVRLNDERTLTDYEGAIYYKEDNILDYSPNNCASSVKALHRWFSKIQCRRLIH